MNCALCNFNELDTGEKIIFSLKAKTIPSKTWLKKEQYQESEVLTCVYLGQHNSKSYQVRQKSSEDISFSKFLYFELHSLSLLCKRSFQDVHFTQSSLNYFTSSAIGNCLKSFGVHGLKAPSE